VDSVTKFGLASTSHGFLNVAPGTYTVRVESDNGCVGTKQEVILHWPSLPMYAKKIIPPFYGMNNGSLSVTDDAVTKLATNYTYTFGNSNDTVFHNGQIEVDTLHNIGADSVSVHLDYLSYNNCWGTGYLRFNMPSLPPFNPLWEITPSCYGMAGQAKVWLFQTPLAHIYVDCWSEFAAGPFPVSVSVDRNTFVYFLYDSANTLLGTYSGRPDFITFTQLLPGSYTVVLKRNMTSRYGSLLINYDGDSAVFNFTIPNLGPNCGTITGNCYLDLNQNCVNDSQDVNLRSNLLKFTNGPYTFYAVTDNDGNYSADVGYGTYMLQSQNWQNIGAVQWCPAPQTPFVIDPQQPTYVLNIADTAYGPVDLRIRLNRTGIPRPGGNITIYIDETNKSGRIAPNTNVTLNYDPDLTAGYFHPTPILIQPGLIVWDADSLLPLETNRFDARFYLPTNAAVTGSYEFTGTVQPVPLETNVSNNTSNKTVQVVSSLDPNDKQAEPPGYGVNHFLTPGNEIDYTIRFQNTGTDTAFYVMVADTLSDQLNIGSFQVISSSHEMVTDFEFPSTVKFIFNNIILPDSTTNEPESHGYVNFSIKTKTAVSNNSLLENTAAIYFDFNPPVITNTVFHTLSYTWTGLEDPVTEKNNLFTVYPNPSTGIFNITSNSGAEIDQLFVYDVYGRMVENFILENKNSATVDLSTFPSGIYLIEIGHAGKVSRLKVMRR
jgi:uncharacterized repeat protein (TIGR01451 family)